MTSRAGKKVAAELVEIAKLLVASEVAIRLSRPLRGYDAKSDLIEMLHGYGIAADVPSDDVVYVSSRDAGRAEELIRKRGRF